MHLALNRWTKPEPRVRVAGHVGAETPLVTPLMSEPLVVTHADAMGYLNAIDDLITCLDKDARDTLIFQSPGKLRADAQTLYDQARELDKCPYENPYLCPRVDQEPLPKPSEIKGRVAADALRAQGHGKTAAAEAMEKRATDRDLKNDAAGNAQVTAELAFYQDLLALKHDEGVLHTTISSASITGSSEWKKIQALDVRYQTLRKRYEGLGFTPTCDLPTFPQAGFPSVGIPWWAWLVGLGVVGGGAYVALK